jgi:hypothetical protein
MLRAAVTNNVTVAGSVTNNGTLTSTQPAKANLVFIGSQTTSLDWLHNYGSHRT